MPKKVFTKRQKLCVLKAKVYTLLHYFSFSSGLKSCKLELHFSKCVWRNTDTFCKIQIFQHEIVLLYHIVSNFVHFSRERLLWTFFSFEWIALNVAKYFNVNFWQNKLNVKILFLDFFRKSGLKLDFPT